MLDEEEEEVTLSPDEPDAFLDELFEDVQMNADDAPSSFNIKHIECHSRNKAGHEHVTTGGETPTEAFDINQFITTANTAAGNGNPTTAPVFESSSSSATTPTKHDLVKTIAKHRQTFPPSRKMK